MTGREAADAWATLVHDRDQAHARLEQTARAHRDELARLAEQHARASAAAYRRGYLCGYRARERGAAMDPDGAARRTGRPRLEAA